MPALRKGKDGFDALVFKKILVHLVQVVEKRLSF